MNTFFKLVGLFTVLGGIAYAFYRFYDRKCVNEFLPKRLRDRKNSCGCNYEDFDEAEESVSFEDITDEAPFQNEKISADEFMTEDEIKGQDSNDENAEF